MGFGSGFVTGLASSFDKALQLNNKNIMDSMSKAETYMYERRAQEDKRMREKADEYEDTIKDLANYVDTTNLPQGVTATDVAGAWLAKSGGSLNEAKNTLAELQKARLAYGDEGARLIFTKAQSTGMSARDIGRTFVRPPDLDYIRGPAQKRKTLFGDDIDITARAAERVGMPTDEQTRKAFDTSGFEGLSVGGKLFTKTETETAAKKDVLALEAAELANQKTRKEMGEINAFDATSIRQYFDRYNKNAAAVTGNINPTTGDPEFKTTADAYNNGRIIYERSLQNLTNEMLNTNSFGVKTNDSTFRGVAQQVLPFYPNNKAPNGKKGQMEIGKLYTVPKEDGSGPRTILWLGSEDNIFEIN